MIVHNVHFLKYVAGFITLNYSLIYSYLSYCTASWASNYPTKRNCLLLLQKRVLRIITRSGWRDHSGPLFSTLGILNISEINKLQLDDFVYKHQNNLLPEIYDSYFLNISDVHHYHTRSRTNQHLFITRPRTNQYAKFSVNVRYAAAGFWNKILLNIKNTASLQSFRKDFKEYLLSSGA